MIARSRFAASTSSALLIFQIYLWLAHHSLCLFVPLAFLDLPAISPRQRRTPVPGAVFHVTVAVVGISLLAEFSVQVNAFVGPRSALFDAGNGRLSWKKKGL
uniref:(northern house mosquito) hypothetical protein n=1 Tax=Culex pipiens TaxID=7175 RepID=A0A8D8CJK2_CULPI